MFSSREYRSKVVRPENGPEIPDFQQPKMARFDLVFARLTALMIMRTFRRHLNPCAWTRRMCWLNGILSNCRVRGSKQAKRPFLASLGASIFDTFGVITQPISLGTAYNWHRCNRLNKAVLTI